MKTTTTDYETQAIDFCAKWQIKFKATRAQDNVCPPFCDGKHIHGDKHQVTLNRAGVSTIRFSFWNSLNDSQQGQSPTAYDVLACASGDVNCPDTFEEFCSEFGYEQDSRKAEKTFKLCLAQAKRLRKVFDSEEIIAELQTIN